MIKNAAWSLITLALILFPIILNAQKSGVIGSVDYENRRDKIYQLHLQDKYYECIEEIDAYHKIYPWTARLRFTLKYHDGKAVYNDVTYISFTGDIYEPDTLSWVDSPPDFDECNTNIYSYLNKKLNEKLPESSSPGAGMIIASFYVMPDGNLTGIRIEKSFDDNLNPILIEVLDEMPAWNPGYHEGNPVIVKMGLPVRFTPDINEEVI